MSLKKHEKRKNYLLPNMYTNTLFVKNIKNSHNYKTFFSTIDDSTSIFFKKNLNRLKKKTNKYRFKKKTKYSIFTKNKLIAKKVLPKLKFGSNKLIFNYKSARLKKTKKSNKYICMVKQEYGKRTN